VFSTTEDPNVLTRDGQPGCDCNVACGPRSGGGGGDDYSNDPWEYEPEYDYAYWIEAHRAPAARSPFTVCPRSSR